MKESLIGMKTNGLITQELIYTCIKRYKNTPQFGHIVKDGWPGVKGTVKLGYPAVNRFGEIIVVYRNENGYMKSAPV